MPLNDLVNLSYSAINARAFTDPIFFSFYSARNASTGFMRAALRAGMTPATIPMNTASASAITTKCQGVWAGIAGTAK